VPLTCLPRLAAWQSLCTGRDPLHSDERGALAGEDSANLVRGEDRYHHFALEPEPKRDLDPEFVALHRSIAERNAKILYRGTNIASYNEPKALAERG
jgi:hypothetical protein